MQTTTRLNYEELNVIGKYFHDEGDDYAHLVSITRQKVAALRTEWEGDAAENFFNEMDNVLIPALARVSQSLIISQEVLIKVMKTVYEADQETTSYFKDVGTGGEDFGAGMFNDALGGSSGAGAEDFGAGAFTQAGGLAGSGGSAGSSDSADPLQGTGSAVDPFKTPSAETQSSAETQPAAETPPASTSAGGGGGGGGGGSSSGLQGDLSRLGSGLGGQPASSASVGGSSGGAESLPDHNFGGDSSGSGGAGAVQSVQTGGASSGSDGSVSTGAENLAAGVAGVVGSAAIGGAAKVIKNTQENGDK
ncbi:MAG: WXG100 family type VII secretion target [Chloroflexi bacterium]|nr:WXG100 family type VII secretion target [Chloroflexota bacterium]